MRTTTKGEAGARADEWDFVWCIFRNITHAVYRELRHVGPKGTGQTKCVIDGKAAALCAQNRSLLKGTALAEEARRVPFPGTDRVGALYRRRTGIAPEETVGVFREHGWTPLYGGEKWARIAELMLALKREIDRRDLPGAQFVCERIRRAEHNSGLLVPASKADWHGWTREKWPDWCGEDGDRDVSRVTGN